jgi:Gluconate 2-dehydrogenase subunit 3
VSEIPVSEARAARPPDTPALEQVSKTLVAIVSRLVPGADAAALATFVAARTAGSVAVHEGLAQLAAKGYADFSPTEQIAVLTELEHGEFFEAVRLAAVQGAFSDPVHGANRDRFGWQLLGYPGAKQIWSAAEQRIVVQEHSCH